MRIVNTRIVHGDPEKACCTQRLHVRGQLFQVTSGGFFALINTKEDLRGWPGARSGDPVDAPVVGQRLEDAGFVIELVGQVEQSGALGKVEGIDFGDQIPALLGAHRI